MAKVFIANNKSFEIKTGETFLDAARKEKLILEHSCRSGRCGICKVAVVSGVTIAIKDELSLTVEEERNGYILTCCRTSDNDVVLDVEDIGQLEDIQIKTLPARIDSLHYLTTDVINIVLRLPPNSGFLYLPGQYIDVIGKTGVRRSYSIANAPRTDGKIELQIRKVKNGVLSNYWFNEVKENDFLRIEGPLGTFFLRNILPTYIVFLATGTGIAPIKAMLEYFDAQPHLVAHKIIYVYWGGRAEQDIYWRPEFSNIDIRFYLALSRSDEQWLGRQGYIQNVLLEDKIPLEDSVIYACGAEKMIHSSAQLLIEHGLDPKNFYSDAFISSN